MRRSIALWICVWKLIFHLYRQHLGYARTLQTVDDPIENADRGQGNDIFPTEIYVSTYWLRRLRKCGNENIKILFSFLFACRCCRRRRWNTLTHMHTTTHPREIVHALYRIFFSCYCYCCHCLSVFCCCLLKGSYAAIENAHVVFSYVTRLIVWHICKLIKIVRKEMNCSNADNFIVAHTSFFPWFWHIY